MNKSRARKLVDPFGNSQGAVAVTTAIFLVVLLAVAAAAIDIGHALVARNELQTTADAAALAGTRALGIIYEGMTPAEQQVYVLTGGDQATVVDAVQSTAVANSAAGVSISMPNSIMLNRINRNTGNRSANSAATAPRSSSLRIRVFIKVFLGRCYFVCTPLVTTDRWNSASGFSKVFR